MVIISEKHFGLMPGKSATDTICALWVWFKSSEKDKRVSTVFPLTQRKHLIRYQENSGGTALDWKGSRKNCTHCPWHMLRLPYTGQMLGLTKRLLRGEGRGTSRISTMSTSLRSHPGLCYWQNKKRNLTGHDEQMMICCGLSRWTKQNKTKQKEKPEKFRNWSHASRKKNERLQAGDTHEDGCIRLLGEEIPKTREFKCLGWVAQEDGRGSRHVAKEFKPYGTAGGKCLASCVTERYQEWNANSSKVYWDQQCSMGWEQRQSPKAKRDFFFLAFAGYTVRAARNMNEVAISSSS